MVVRLTFFKLWGNYRTREVKNIKISQFDLPMDDQVSVAGKLSKFWRRIPRRTLENTTRMKLTTCGGSWLTVNAISHRKRRQKKTQTVKAISIAPLPTWMNDIAHYNK